MRTSRRKITNRARGLSFVEILAALAIVIAIAAVAVPWTFGWLGGRELDNAEDQLAMQLVMARAAAREEGRPVEVVATSALGRSTIRARWMEELLPEGRDFGRSDESDRPRREDPSAEQDASIAANWADMDLPTGVELWLEDELPDESRAGDPDDDGSEPASADARSDEAIDAMDEAMDGAFARPPQVLAIFLPDGTAIVAPVLMLRTGSGVQRSLLIDRVTGRPRSADEPKPQSPAVSRPDFDMPADADR